AARRRCGGQRGCRSRRAARRGWRPASPPVGPRRQRVVPPRWPPPPSGPTARRRPPPRPRGGTPGGRRTPWARPRRRPPRGAGGHRRELRRRPASLGPVRPESGDGHVHESGVERRQLVAVEVPARFEQHISVTDQLEELGPTPVHAARLAATEGPPLRSVTPP